MTKARFLVVEDDLHDVFFLGTVLAAAGINYVVETSGVKAHERLRHEEFDAVLMNLVLPDIDGMALLYWCKQERPGLPIIIVTGHDAEQNVELAGKAARAGAIMFVKKPYRNIENQWVFNFLTVIAAQKRRQTMWGRVKDPIAWVWGFGAGMISGGATAVGSIGGTAVMKVMGFNVELLTGKQALPVFVSGALWGAFAYLAKSPLPELKARQETEIIKKNET